MVQEITIYYKARLRAKRQLTLPDEVRDILNIDEGEELAFLLTEQGQIIVEKVNTIPPEQAWFWSERWQRLERTAEADIEAGRVHSFDNIDEAIAALDGGIENADRGAD